MKRIALALITFSVFFALPGYSQSTAVDFSYVGRYVGEEIEFKNQSQNATSCSWDFGDGSPKSEEEHPRHSYRSAGVYPVSLVVKNLAGDSAKKAQKVFIFKKGGVWLINLRVPIKTITPGKPYKNIVIFLADEGVRILEAYFFWNREGPIVGTIREIEYDTPGRFFVSLRTNNPGNYKLECYVTYKEAGKSGKIKKSNYVSTNIVVW